MILGKSPFLSDANQSAQRAQTDLVVVTEQNFQAEVLQSELPVLLYFTAVWCQPCKTVAPIVAQVAQELEGKVKVVKIDIDKSPLITKQLRVQSVPTFMVFASGRIQDVVTGAIGKKQLLSFLDPHLPRESGALKPEELMVLLKEHQVAPVDVRDAAAYARAHLPSAVNIPAAEIENRIAELYMLQGAPVLYCRSGDISKTLVQKLAESGVEAGFLEGGLLAWESSFLPIER